ncbi:MAG: hypothetical protein VCF24_26630 [Candidatus Latescibacterota bacterium]
MSSLPLSRLVLCAVLLVAGVVTVQAGDIEATVVDRKGVRHAVRKLEIRGSTTLEYYVSGKRRRMDMARIERIHIAGTAQDQEAPVTVTLRTGRIEEGTIIINAGSSPDNAIAAGGSHISDRLTGSTSLGPLFVPLSDVRDVFFVHDENEPIVPDAVTGSIVDERGRRFAVSDIRYRGDEAFRFQQGRKKRRVALRHVSRLEFGDSPGGEMRPVKITYRTGRVVQGEVDASTVRMAGEGDHVYRTRVDSAFTGISPSGVAYGIGLKTVMLVLIDHETDEEASDESRATAEEGVSRDH